MESKQNVSFSPEEEYQYFLNHMKFNKPEDVKYVEDVFNRYWNFKPYYFDNGLIDINKTMKCPLSMDNLSWGQRMQG
jgi:hypothetical protein